MIGRISRRCSALLLLCLALGACAHDVEETPILYTPVATQAETEFATRGPIETLRIFPGVVRSPASPARLEFGPGRIGTLYAWPGDRVYEGQLIARLDTTHMDREIGSLEDSISRMEAMFRFRSEDMALQIEILRIDLAAAVRDNEAAGGAGGGQIFVRMLRERLEWMRLDLSQLRKRHEFDMAQMLANLEELIDVRQSTEIRAPFDGEVVQSLQLGAWVNAGEPVMYIVRDSEVLIENLWAGLNPAWINTAAMVVGYAGGRTYEIEQLRLTAEELADLRSRGITSGRLPIRFAFSDPSGGLPSEGDAVFIRLYSVREEDALRIPRQALYRDEAGAHVYRIDNGERTRVDLTVGVVNDTFAQILGGLEEGDEVLVRP